MTLDILESFHPAVARWFAGELGPPTEPQVRGWPAIQARRNTLIAAPTGSGKTLAAFLAAIDALVRQGVARDGVLPDETQVVYVSPLKALSNDIQRNLEEPLLGIGRELEALGLPAAGIRTSVRTGDTPAAARQAMVARPPHLFVTTPESLYILLTSERGRRMLATAHTVIVDEIHALVRDKRGSHLALSLERLAALTSAHRGGDQGLVRIGLSATQRPIDEIARFLVGAEHIAANGEPECTIIDAGHRRTLDLALELPRSPLEAVMSAEVWTEVYDRLADLIREHRTTLVFVNTRRLAERLSRHLSERLGEEHVTSHHGSLAREQRFLAEQRLKAGELKALVATASLELGIDIGAVDLVCQIGSTRSIATFLQRVGRSGHHLAGVPKGRLFPTSRDELVECAALLDSVGRGELDRIMIPEAPLDILAQQIVAAVAAEEWSEDELFDSYAAPIRSADSRASDFDQVVGHARRRLHDAARPARRLSPPRSGERALAGPARGAARRHHIGRRHPGHRRLRGRARARRDSRRHGERGLRHREHGGRHLPARQRLVADPAHRAGSRSRRGCARRAADDPVLVRRGAGPHRGAVVVGVALPLRGGGASAAGGARGGTRVARSGDRNRSPCRRADRRLPGRGARGARGHADAGDHRGRTLLRRERRHAARRARALRQPSQSRLGAVVAQALLPALQLRAAGGGHRGRDRALARPHAQLPARRDLRVPQLGHRARRAGAGAAGRTHVRHPLALEHDPRPRGAALPRRPQGATPLPAHGRRRSARARLSRSGRVPREPAPGPRRFPSIRSFSRPFATAWTRRWTSRRWNRC